MITINHPLVSRYLGKLVGVKYEHSNSPIWKMYLNDILADMYAEKLVILTSKHMPDKYDSLTNINKSAVDETMQEAHKFIIKKRNECSKLLHESERISIN